MGVYIPLKVRLAKASIPQVVAYIQTYLEDNPIPAMDTFAELIAEFLSDHPELVAVASVNAKTGAVILTGADIMLNANADVTIDTEVTNLNTMIASLSSQVAQAVTTVGGFETSIENINDDIDTINVALDTKDTEIYQINQTLTNHLNGINANTTKNAQQDTRLTALENALDALESDYNDLNTQVTLHTQQITALQGMIGDSSEILEHLTEVENGLNEIVSDLNSSDSYTWTEKGITFSIYRKGDVCVLLALTGSTTEAISSNGILCTIPEKYKPINNYFFNNASALTICTWLLSGVTSNVVLPSGNQTIPVGSYPRFAITYFIGW